MGDCSPSRSRSQCVRCVDQPPIYPFPLELSADSAQTLAMRIMDTRPFLGFMALLAVPFGLALATPPLGMTSQASFRSPLKVNIYSTQWGPSPLFNLLLQTSPDDWGYDLVQGVGTFAAADANGTPSQSG